MTSNINYYVGNAANLYRPTKFSLTIDTLPEKINPIGINPFQFNRSFNFDVQDVFFPSRNISSEPIKLAGPVDEIPYEATYSGDLDVTLRVSNDFKERIIFETWMDIVINQKTQNLAYPDSYRCDATISALGLDDTILYEIKLTDVWPKSVGRISVGQGNTDTIATMQLSLAWRKYIITYLRKNSHAYFGDVRNPMIGDKLNNTRSYGGMYGIQTVNESEAEDKIKNTIKENIADIRDNWTARLEYAKRILNPRSDLNAGSDFNPDFVK